MSKLQQTPTESARKIEARLLQRLASVGQVRVAESLGVSEASVSRLKEDGVKLTFGQVAQLLCALGLDVVPEGAHVVDQQRLDALITLAELGFSRLKNEI